MMADGAAAALAAGVHLAAVLLVLAGADKVVRPRATSAALTLAGLPGRRELVVALGVGELALAVAVLVVGGRAATVALGLAYLAFTVFAARQRRADADCGCFGVAVGVTRLHLVVDAAAVAVALAAASGPQPVAGLPRLLADQPLAGAPELAALAVAAVLLRVSLTAMPILADALATTREAGG